VPLEKAVALCGGYELALNALGECYLRLERYEDAVKQFTHVLMINPMAAKTRNFLGVAYASLKRYDEAERQLISALKKDPEFSNARFNLGRVYEMKSEYGKAIEQYEKALETSEDNQDRAVAFTRIGDAYLKTGSRDKAKASYLKALDAGKESETIKSIVEEKLKDL
jgi:tetratricopeptide (TPR) repeat protein